MRMISTTVYNDITLSFNYSYTIIKCISLIEYLKVHFIVMLWLNNIDVFYHIKQIWLEIASSYINMIIIVYLKKLYK